MALCRGYRDSSTRILKSLPILVYPRLKDNLELFSYTYSQRPAEENFSFGRGVVCVGSGKMLVVVHIPSMLKLTYSITKS